MTTLELIHNRVKQVKEIILDMIEKVLEPTTWDEFIGSKDPRSHILEIRDDDLPIIRDTKAFLNMLIAIEGATDRLTKPYPHFFSSMYNKSGLVNDYINFRRNYKIYMSTTSILTQYLSSMKDAIVLILPKLLEKMLELAKLCSTENLEKAADFFIQQVIVLEQYQENYVQRKKLPPKKEIVPVKKPEGDDSVTFLIKKINSVLKSIYKEKYETHFPVSADINYYSEKKEDSDIIKQTKLLLNGIIGIKKVLDDHESYQNANVVSGIFSAADFITDLRKIYNSLQEFDYQAIIAEKSGPYTRMIKYLLNVLNDLLERLACIADKFENEFRLKEGILLGPVDLLVQRHNQITNELRINPEVAQKFEDEFHLKDGSLSKVLIDLLIQKDSQETKEDKNQAPSEKKELDFKTSQPNYVKQKGIYFKARQQSRREYLNEIDTQIRDLQDFLHYKNHALSDIPYYVIHSIQAYIKKYSDIICLENTKLEKYNLYLKEALKVERGFKSLIANQCESLANYCSQTIHSDVMLTLYMRHQYLLKQRIFLVKKLEHADEERKKMPFTCLNSLEVLKLGTQEASLIALNQHVDELQKEEKDLLAKIYKKSEKKEVKSIEAKEKSAETIDLSDQLDPRLINQFKIKAKEKTIVTEATARFKETHSYKPLRDILRKEDCLAPKSVILLDEVIGLMCAEEQKSMKLD